LVLWAFAIDFSIDFEEGKHHEYQDGRYSGFGDVHCTNSSGNIVRMDSRGELRSPPLPKRPLELRSPAGEGDLWDYNNVGSRDKFSGFMDALDDFGFAGKRIWQDACFYSSGAKSPNRAFYCSNNEDKRCCLEDVPICKIPNSWPCHQ